MQSNSGNNCYSTSSVTGWNYAFTPKTDKQQNWDLGILADYWQPLLIFRSQLILQLLHNSIIETCIFQYIKHLHKILSWHYSSICILKTYGHTKKCSYVCNGNNANDLLLDWFFFFRWIERFLNSQFMFSNKLNKTKCTKLKEHV